MPPSSSDLFTTLPPELITHIVELVNNDVADVIERKANVRALRLVSGKISQCSRDAMLTVYFRHIRLLYTYPAVHSLIEFTQFPDVVAKIESITIALVASKWRECPPPDVQDRVISVAKHIATVKVYQWEYLEPISRRFPARTYVNFLETALDKAFATLRNCGKHVHLRAICCSIATNTEIRDDNSRSKTILDTYMGARRLRQLRPYNRDKETLFSYDAAESPTPTDAVRLLLCALARTGYSPATLDLDFRESGPALGQEVPSLERGVVLPAELLHPLMTVLTTLKLYIDHAEFVDQGYGEFRRGMGVVEVGKWLGVMPALEYLSLRFTYHKPGLFDPNVNETYLHKVAASMQGLHHTRLSTLVLDYFRATSAALKQLLGSQASSLRQLALIRCELLEASSAWCPLLPRMAQELCLTDLLFVQICEGPTHLASWSSQSGNAAGNELPARGPYNWWCTGAEKVKAVLEDAGHLNLPLCDCEERDLPVCCRWPCDMRRDFLAWDHFEPIAWSGFRCDGYRREDPI